MSARPFLALTYSRFYQQLISTVDGVLIAVAQARPQLQAHWFYISIGLEQQTHVYGCALDRLGLRHRRNGLYILVQSLKRQVECIDEYSAVYS